MWRNFLLFFSFAPFFPFFPFFSFFSFFFFSSFSSPPPVQGPTPLSFFYPYPVERLLVSTLIRSFSLPFSTFFRCTRCARERWNWFVGPETTTKCKCNAATTTTTWTAAQPVKCFFLTGDPLVEREEGRERNTRYFFKLLIYAGVFSFQFAPR